jgi:hypothetical protein
MPIQVFLLIGALSQVQSPKVDPDLLSGIEDRQPVRSFDQNYDEARSYDYLLVKANKTDQAELTKFARRDTTFVHLLEEPEKYRGEIVHIEGSMRRLRRFDATTLAVKEGVPVLFEGWIFPEGAFANPYCVILSELPEGMKVGEKVDYKVAFDGYFFKVYRYKAGDGNRIAPLLIGRGIQLLETPAGPAEESSELFGGGFTLSFLGIIGGTILLALGLGWWYRRGDRSIRARLNHVRNSNFSLPEDEAGNATAEVNGTGGQN